MVSLLTGSAPHARLFVPESQRAALANGARLRVQSESTWRRRLAPRVVRLTSETAFTPYAPGGRRRQPLLTWRAEAVLENDAAARVCRGLPLQARWWPMATPELAIRARGLTRRFGAEVTAVDRVDLDVAAPRSGFWPQRLGCRSTTIRMLCRTAHAPAAATHQCWPAHPGVVRGASSAASAMTQKFSLYEDLTVEEPEFLAAVHDACRAQPTHAHRRADGHLQAGRAARPACRHARADQTRPGPRPGGAAPAGVVSWRPGRPARSIRSKRRAVRRCPWPTPAPPPCWCRPTTWTRPSAVTVWPLDCGGCSEPTSARCAA